MDLNFNININNSFNKKDSSNLELGKPSSLEDRSVQNLIVTNSRSSTSSTGIQIEGSNFSKNIQSKPSMIREIIVGISSALLATIISYFAFGIK